MTSNSTSALEAEFLQILAAADPLLEVADSTTFGVIPNPFYKYPKSTAVNKDTYLYMLDGGDTGEGMPIWPWIQSQRQIDVIISKYRQTSLRALNLVPSFLVTCSLNTDPTIAL